MQPPFETFLTRYQELTWGAWIHVNMLALQEREEGKTRLTPTIFSSLSLA